MDFLAIQVGNCLRKYQTPINDAKEKWARAVRFACGKLVSKSLCS